MTSMVAPTTTAGTETANIAADTRHTVRTMCPMNCNPTYCGMLVDIEHDRVVGVRGDRDNPDSHGFLCIRGQATVEIVDSPLRILRPRLRGCRGEDTWQDASWDVALDRIADAIRRAGPDGVAVWLGHGLIVNNVHRQLAQRLTNLGGYQWWHPSIVCWGLGGFGISLTGPLEVSTKEDMAANAELIVLWGANLASQPTTGPSLIAAKRRGARIIAIDVRHTEAFDQAHETYIIRPGTDAALALAMINVIIEEDLHDRGFIERNTTGFEALREHIRQYTPAWAAVETGIDAEAIRALARQYAATKQSMILLGGSSMHKSSNGWQAGRAVACLPALTGSLGRPGGGMGPRHGAKSSGQGLNDSAAADDRRPEGSPMISEMSTILNELESGRIKVLLLLGTNMLSCFADTVRLKRAMAQMDCVVSHDLFMNDTARECADVLLPGTSWVEETGYKITNTHLYLMDQAVSARGEARPVGRLLNELADRLGVEDFFPWQDIDGLMTQMFDHPATGHISTEQLRAQGGIQPLAVSHVAHPTLDFPTPSGKVEFYSEQALTLGMPALPVYEPTSEDARREPKRAERYPLIFRQGRTLTHFHSFYDHGQALPTLAKADPEPRLWISPTDAAARGLAEGDPIRLHNDRGEMYARTTVTDKVPSGVVWMHDGWRGINDLTSGARSVTDAAARSFPGGSAAYEARIEVCKAGG